MSCVSCRAELKPNAKFCGSCGAKVQAGGGAEKLILSPNPLGLRECEVKVIAIKGEGPDGDGDVRIEIKYEVKNRTDEDWEYLVARTQVLDSRGLVVEETRDTNEQTVSAGESAECETYLSIKLKTLGENPEKANVLVSVVACGIALQKLGEFDVPATAFDVVPLKSTKVGNVLQLVSGSLWKTEPDSDKDSSIQVRALVQNLTAMHVHEVKLIAEVTDKVGRDVSDAGGSDEVRPGDVCLISGSGYGKDKQFKGAKVALSLRAYFSAATGLSQHVGIEIHESESRAEVEDDEDSSTDDGNGDGADFSPVSSNRLKEGALTQIFYGNMKWFDVAEQPSDIEDIPAAFAEAKSLWEEDKEGNLNQILELLSEYVGARFLPSNITGWEELFEDPDGNGIPEIEARQVRVVGIDFSSSPIPKCKAEAIFDVVVTNQFLSTDLDEWQESNSPFTDAVIFYWNIPKNKSTEDLDFTAGDNQGVECVCVDQNPFENSGELSEEEEDVEDDGGGQAEQSSDEGKCESPSDDIVVRFALTKGEGDWPEESELSDDEKHDPALLALFNLNWDPDGAVDLGDVEIESCEVIFDGVTYSETLEEGLRLDDGMLVGYPSPVIRFRLSRPVDPQEFRRAIWTSSVRLLPASRAELDRDGFYCEDMNGYCSVLSKKQINEVQEASRLDRHFYGISFTSEQLSSGVKAIDMRGVVAQNPFENSGELSASDDMEWQINAGWETRKGNKLICRWFVCWRVLADDQIVGAVAGYSGGSSFEVERFYGRLDGGNLSSLWMDFTDRVTGEEVDFDTLDDEIRSACESALDQIWEWNDNDEWGDSDEVVLLKAKREDLAAKKEMLYLAKDSAPFLQTICEKAGLTAAPGK